LGVEFTVIDARDSDDIERGISLFARKPNGGLIVVVAAFATAHRDVIISLAAQHRLPAIYPYRYFVTSGGLMSYGPDTIDQYRQAAGYVDRILRGEKAADLPVQQPNKFELVINLKAAKALGLTIPETLLATDDEVIQ
jgi:putative ABC transport system substrate-binding protein